MPLEQPIAEAIVAVPGLEDLARPPAAGVGIIRWRRQLAPLLQAEARALLGHDGLDLVAEAPPACLQAEVRAVLRDQPRLAADVAALVHAFAAASGAGRCRLRLRRVDGDACRRWHVDNVPWRLICTYVGPGTELLTGPEAAPARTGGQPASTLRAFALAAGEVALFRGGSAGGGVVHRSPPIAGTGQARLVLVIDTGLPRA